MVLSNKKLKQKLRAELSKSLVTKTLSNNTDSNPTNPEKTPKSLKQLLDSATQKPSLSKREKRRKTLNLQPPQVSENGENRVAHVGETENNNGKVKGKKRKREKKGSEEGKKSDDGVDGELGLKEEGEDLNKEGEESKKNPKKKKKKKKKHKKKGKKEKQENQSDVQIGAAVEQIVPVNVEYEISQASEEDTKKVYVGGIPFYSTEDDIRSYFDHCGTIIDVDCMMFPESGKFRGIAMISFKTAEAAKRALGLDGSDMGGLFLKIQPYKSTRTTKPTTTTDFSPPVITGYNRVYAGNLSWDITEEDLKNLFSDCKISAIRFGEDKATGEFKGYAHVDFADHPSLTKALKLDQSVVCGRPVRIRCAVPPKKGDVIGNVGPINPSTQSTVVAVEAETETQASTVENQTSITINNVGVSSGKLKRRTCYECGEKGHISSDCPNKQAVEKTNPSAS